MPNESAPCTNVVHEIVARSWSEYGSVCPITLSNPVLVLGSNGPAKQYGIAQCHFPVRCLNLCEELVVLLLWTTISNISVLFGLKGLSFMALEHLCAVRWLTHRGNEGIEFSNNTWKRGSYCMRSGFSVPVLNSFVPEWEWGSEMTHYVTLCGSGASLLGEECLLSQKMFRLWSQILSPEGPLRTLLSFIEYFHRFKSHSSIQIVSGFRFWDNSHNRMLVLWRI